MSASSTAPARAVDAPTVTEALRRTAVAHPDLTAVRALDESVSLSWSALLARVDAVAGGLEKLGLGRRETVLDADFAPQWAAQHGLGDATFQELARELEMIAAVQEGVDEANRHLARVEQVKKFKILPNAWPPGGDELTPTMKLKRRPIAAKFAAEIEAMYAE